MRIFSFVIALLMANPAAAGSEAYFQTGNMLLAQCSQEEVTWIRAQCQGYVLAIADVLVFDQVGIHKACLPRRVNGRQIEDIVMQHLRQHPDIRHQSAAKLAVEALAKAFPCQ